MKPQVPSRRIGSVGEGRLRVRIRFGPNRESLITLRLRPAERPPAPPGRRYRLNIPADGAAGGDDHP